MAEHQLSKDGSSQGQLVNKKTTCELHRGSASSRRTHETPLRYYPGNHILQLSIVGLIGRVWGRESDRFAADQWNLRLERASSGRSASPIPDIERHWSTQFTNEPRSDVVGFYFNNVSRTVDYISVLVGVSTVLCGGRANT